MQHPLEHLEANVRPSWHGIRPGTNPRQRTKRLRKKMQLRLAATWIHVVRFFLFFHFFVFFPHWFVYVKSLWLTQLVTYLYPLIVPVLGMIRPCGATRLQTDLAIYVITNRGTTPHYSVTLDGFWSSST